MGISTADKLQLLKNDLAAMESVLVAYSGGVDSAFLLKVTADVLGKKATAVTANARIHSAEEIKQAQSLAAELHCEHIIIETEPLANPHFASNPPDRCYHCRKELFARLSLEASRYSRKHILDGANSDDSDDYRPGMKAAAEWNVRSPLKDAGLTKPEIRALSREMDLPTWDKPASPCLATRIPYGTAITAEKLSRIKHAEDILRSLGIGQVRVRDHGDLARIEVAHHEMPILRDEDVSRIKVVQALKQLGYQYVTLDLEGYRTGSMNETLKGIAEHE